MAVDLVAPVLSGLVGAAVMGAGALCGHLITWGKHANTVAGLTAANGKLEARVQSLEATGAADKISALTDRVAKLETDVSKVADAMGKLEISNARVETKLEALGEHLKDLNASIRWMRDPAAYDPAKG